MTEKYIKARSHQQRLDDLETMICHLAEQHRELEAQVSALEAQLAAQLSTRRRKIAA